MDLFENVSPKDNTPVFSVSELSGALKKTVENAFSNVRLRGEVGRVTRPASGHVYLDLKDEKSVINCNIWKPSVSKLEIFPEEGMEVIATGKLSTYAPSSKYNFIIETLEIAGEGALMALLEKRKKALAAEGLFDADRKQLLPYLPKRIGVITSRTGAVIKDILHRLSDRFPCEVILWPVTVQGDKCADEVVAAIEGFNALPDGHPLRPDVVIVARGGGSIEDLWGFNEERVVRAVAASMLPIISAVGHETDTTLIDFASDQRAPTPSAAAEMAVPVRGELMATLADLEVRRLRALTRIVSGKTQMLRDLARSLPRGQNLLDTPRQRLDLASSRIGATLSKTIGLKRNHFGMLAGKLTAQSVLRNIEAKRSALGNSAHKLTPAMQARMQSRNHSLMQINANLARAFDRRISDARAASENLFGRFSSQSVERNIDRKRADLHAKSQNLLPAFARKIAGGRMQLTGADRLLNAVSYERILERGYAVIRDENGQFLSSANQTAKAISITIKHHDGLTSALVKPKA